MQLTFLVVVLVVTPSTTQLSTDKHGQNRTMKGPSTRNRELKNTHSSITKWDFLMAKQIKTINKLIKTLKSKSGGCTKVVNIPKYCKLHWVPDTLLRLAVRLDSKKNEVQFKTESEKEIHDKHLMINNLIENMVTVADCPKEKESKKKEEQLKKGSKTSKKSEDDKGKEGKVKVKDDVKKEKEEKTETEEKKKESKEVGVTAGQTGTGAEDKIPSPDGSADGSPELSGDGSPELSGDGSPELSGDGSPEPDSETSDGGTDKDPTAEPGSGDSESGDKDPSATSSEDGTEAKEDDEEEEEEDKSDCDYSNFGESHTMLLPPNDCKIHETGLEEGDKEEILRLHNTLRAKVARGEETDGNPGPQPPAANMRELVWNDQLAEVAEAWAKQCKQDHDQIGARKICSRPYFVGQNLHFYYGSSPVVDWETAVNDWYIEVADMPNEIAAAFRPLTPVKIGHYTQVVWADTNEIGCGIVHYEAEINGRFFPESKLYACNYGPSGNIKSLPLYAQGPAASECPDGVSKNYPDLCA
ncbi:uncharacterized protein [Palaemon carinicauda]|uniref:uncharacterized protein n=1 Tax=Palaemon carinicauda TaxID=392227 RepID=UPI0035B66581